MASKSAGGGSQQLLDRGWTSPWVLEQAEPGVEKGFSTQSDVTFEGDMALEMAGKGYLMREFPAVSAGTLKIEMPVRLEKATIDISDEKASVIKVALLDKANRGPFRWHYPFAWPEVGGNTYPRFYVKDGEGHKRKNIEYTSIPVEAGRWYKVSAVIHFATRTWEFWMDGVKFNATKELGHEMTWLSWAGKPQVEELLNLRIINPALGKNWVDSIRIWHDGELLSSTDFSNQAGYEAGKSVVGRPRGNIHDGKHTS